MSPLPASLPAVPPPAAVPAVPAATGAPHGWTTYSVRNGDTVYDLALRFHSTQHAIIARNHLAGGGHLIRPGQKLLVPRGTATAAARPAAKPAAPPRPAPRAATSAYRVRAGDTLGAIATRHRTSLATVLKLNQLRVSSVIYPGQVIRLSGTAAATKPTRTTPAAKPSTAKPAQATGSYTVRSGDTLSHIAGRTGTSLGELYRLNRLSSSSIIHPGQKLRTAGKTTTPSKATDPPKGPTSFGGVTYPGTTTGAADKNRHYLSQVSVPSKTETRDMIVATARRHGVDPSLALAIAWQESGWNQRAVSPANAIGVMQVIPLSGTWASELLGRKVNLLNTKDNVESGVVILRALTRSTDKLDVAIAGYYQGLYSVQTKGMYADTKVYVAAIKAHRARF